MDGKYTKELFDNLPDDKKQRVLEGIISEFAASGIDGCNVRNIARKIGISHGSLFHYFPSKDDMVHAIIQEGVRRQKEIFDKSKTPDGNFYLRIETLLLNALNYARSNRDIISIWMELSQPYLNQFTQHTLDMEKEAIRNLKEIVEKAQKDNVVRKELDPDIVAYMLDSLLANLIKSAVSEIEVMKFREHFDSSGDDPERIVLRIMDTLKTCLGAVDDSLNSGV